MADVGYGFFGGIAKVLESVATTNYTPQQQYVYEKTSYNPIYGGAVAGKVNNPGVALKTNFYNPPKELRNINYVKGRDHITMNLLYIEAWKGRKANFNMPTIRKV